MSDSVPAIFNKTTKVDDAVTVFVGGKVFEGWEDLSLTRELNCAASDFQFQMTDKWDVAQDPFPIQPGVPVHIHIGKTSFFQGYADKVKPSFAATKRAIVVAGRSKTQDIVDCSANDTLALQLAGLNIQEVALKLLAPFNISLIMNTSPGAPFPEVPMSIGETVFQVLDKLARQRQILFYPSYEGNLVMAKQGEARATSALTQGVNILSGSANFDNSNRFSKYLVKGQNRPEFGPDFANQGQAVDGGITRYRPLTIMAESTIDDANGQDRADYEAKVRAAKGTDLTVQTVGFFQEDGTPWEINRLVRVDSGFLGVKRQMLIKKVVFNKNGSGTLTTFELTRNDGYLFGAPPKPDVNLAFLGSLLPGGKKQ